MQARMIVCAEKDDEFRDEAEVVFEYDHMCDFVAVGK